MALASGILLAWGIWLPWLRGVRTLSVVAVLLALGVLGLSSFLAVHGSVDTADDDADAVVVLGAAVHGRELSRTLVGRLDTALAYHQRNPRAVIVVSGGQGPQEEVPEAVAMRDYLVSRGVTADAVVLEDRSTSTEENFAFSKVLLDQRFDDDYRVVFVTDEFHVYRAGCIAERAGLAAQHVSSRTPWYFWPANYLRETVAVVMDAFGG